MEAASQRFRTHPSSLSSRRSSSPRRRCRRSRRAPTGPFRCSTCARRCVRRLRGRGTRRAPTSLSVTRSRIAAGPSRSAATRPSDRAGQFPRPQLGCPLAMPQPHAHLGQIEPRSPAGRGRRTVGKRDGLSRESDALTRVAGRCQGATRDPPRPDLGLEITGDTHDARLLGERAALLDPPVPWQSRQVVRGSTPATSVVRALDRRTRTPAGRSPRRAASLPPALRPTRESRPRTSSDRRPLPGPPVRSERLRRPPERHRRRPATLGGRRGGSRDTHASAGDPDAETCSPRTGARHLRRAWCRSTPTRPPGHR